MKFEDICKKYSLGSSDDDKKKTKKDSYQNSNTPSKSKSSFDDICKRYGLGDKKETETKESTESSWDKYKEFANSEEGSKGWQKYLADTEASSQKAIAEEEDKAWWEKLLGYLGDAQDTTLPMAGTTQAIKDLREDDSYARPQDDWSKEQQGIFGYLYSTDPAKAYKYAEEANNLNNKAKEDEAIQKIQDSATSSFGAGVGHTLGAIATAPMAGADFLYDLAMTNAGRPITSDGFVSPFEYSQAVTGGISTHLNEKGGALGEDIPIIGGKGWGDVYGLGTSIAQSALSAYTLGGAGTLISYFGQGAAAGVDDALSRGASDEQAVLYGTVLGVAEGLAEKIGIDNLFKLGASPTLKVAIKNILKQAGAEGLEEGLTSIISDIADNAIMQDQSNFNAMVRAYMAQGMTEAKAKEKAWMDSIESIAFDTLGGFVSGGVHAGAHTGINTALSNNYANKIYGGSEQDLLVEAVDIGGEAANVADKYLAKYEKRGKLSGANLNELVYANEQELRTQDKAKIKSTVEAKLAEYGETGDASSIADVLVKQATGEKLTSKDVNILNNSKSGHLVSTELNEDNIKSGGLANDWARDIGTERINSEAYNRGSEALNEVKPKALHNIVPDDDDTPKEENAIESKFNTSESGKTTVNGSAVSIKEIASVKNGEITLRLENGETVNANDVEFSSSDEMLYATVVDMNLNAETANAFIRGFNASEGLTAERYALGFREAYRYGKYGFPEQEMSRDGFSASLSEPQKKLAYRLGKLDAMYDTDAKQSAVKNAKISNKVADNTMSIEEAEAVAGLTDRQKTSIKGVKALSKSLGVKVRFFESKVNAEGKRVGENGWYDPKTGIVYIDLHAGLKGEGTILFTAAHELTHHIRQWSPAKFKVFADFLLENYGKKGISVDALVRAQMEKAKRNGRDISYDTAYEEVIADSCEAMLADGDAIAKIAKLKAKDRSLWQKIRDFIKDLVSKIKEAYKGLNPDSFEGKEVGKMLDVAEKLKALWTEALVDASDNYNSAEKTLADNGIIVNSNTDSASLLSVRDVLSDEQRQKVSSALAARFGVTQQEAMDWLKAETSMASLILNPKYSQYLDYTPDPNEVAIKQNSDYPQGTVDFSPICAKRREFTSVMNNILRLFPNHVFAATDLAKIRSIMQEEGMTIPCGICYVEDRRQLDTIVAQNFIDSLKLYREGSKTRPDGNAFNANQLKGLSLTDGDSYIPSVYELVSLEGLNILKEKNPNMAEAWIKFNNARGMQSVRLLANEAEYKRQILKYTKNTVKTKNDKGGLRVYSFSDAEMFHLIDIIQVITDSATVGLSLQGYTKVNEYARAVKDTGEKLNRSLIPKGELGYHIEDGKVVLDYDTVEGIDINHPDFFDNKDNPNVGNITIGVSDVQIRAAMVSDFVDQIIPFHTGQSEEVLGEKGISTWSNYKDFQKEKDIATGNASNHQINIYTEVLQVLEKEGKTITKRTFVEKFLQVCKENNLIPRFSQFLNTNENGEYVYTEGYHKMLVDFKTFAQTEAGEYLPQMPVKPIFDNEYITKILKDYVKSQKVKDAELAENMPKVIKRITNEIVKPSEVKLSDRDSLGNELSAEQQEFFKDSKVRDKDGNLLVVYHGSASEFTVFKQNKIGSHGNAHGKGFYFTENEGLASSYYKEGGQLLKGYLDIKNPMSEEKVTIKKSALVKFIKAICEEEANRLVKDDGYGSVREALPDTFISNYVYTYDMSITDAYREVANIIYSSSDSDVDIIAELFTAGARGVTLEKAYEVLGYDGVIYTHPDGVHEFVSFVSSQFKSISNKTPTSDPDIRYSDRDSYAPTFYSHMGKVVDGIKLEKMGANGVVPYLKGKGVKDEEIKWSGIETFLEGKKSVTKADLQEFVAGSQLQIVEQMSGGDIDLRYDGSERAYNLFDENGKVIDTFTYNEFLDGYVAESDEEIYSNANELEEALREKYGMTSAPRWAQYKIDGGSNYRELVFQLPHSTHSNHAMRVHWGQDAEGVLAHARIQDMTTSDGKNMLFIEELQSDWHNEGLQKGYSTKEYEDAKAVYDKLAEDYAKKRRAFNQYVRSSEFRSDSDEVSKKKFDWLRNKMDTAEKRMQDAERDIDSLKAKGMGDVPDAPFRSTYHEYVLKRLLRMAAEEGYDSIGWTPSWIQSDRWSDEFAEAYRIEYDQEIPKFLRKYGKKWGATVEKINLTEGKNLAELEADLLQMEAQLEDSDGAERRLLENNIAIYKDHINNMQNGVGNDVVWSMDITDSMKDSVLNEGQVLYSDRYQSAEENFDILSMTARVESGEFRANEKVFLGNVSNSIAKQIQSLTGINVQGFKVAIEARQIEHILKDHGKHGTADRSMADASNIAKIEYALNAPDDIRKAGKTQAYTHMVNGKNRTADTVLYEKNIGEKSYYVVQAVPDTKAKTLYIVTAFIGKKGYKKEASQLINAKSLDVTAKTGSANASDNIISENADFVKRELSDRDTDSASNRSLLANALESVAQNDIEKNKLTQYKQKITLIESEQKKLAEIRAKIKELSFAKGARDTEAIKKLQFEANQAANRINTYDKQLLGLESTKALKGVLEREKAMLRKRLEQKGKESLAAYREKATKTQRELLTRYQDARKNAVEGRNKTAMRHKIKNVVSDLNKLLLNPTKEQHVPIGLQGVVADALDAINMDTMNAEERVKYYNSLLAKSSDPDEIRMLKQKRDFFEYRDMNFKDRITALKNAYAEFKESDDPLIRNAHNDAIADLISNTASAVGNTSLKDMSFGQLEMVYDMYKAVLATVRNSNKMFKEGRQETVTENSESVKVQVKEAGGHQERVLKATKFLKKAGWDMLKPVTAMKVIGSKTLAGLFDNVRAAEDSWAVDVSEAKEFYEAISNKYGYNKWDFKTRYDFKDSRGEAFSISLEQMMSLYAYSKREQADEHLEFGGFIFDDAIEVTEKNKVGIPLKYEVNDANPHRLGQIQMMEIIGKLTQDQKAFIDEMQAYLSDVMGAKGNEVSLALYDIKLYKEKNYFPLKTARYFREFDPEKSGTPKIKNSGFSKKTVPQAGNPIVLSNFMDVWASHVNDMSMYHAFVLPLEDFMRVYNYSSTAGGYDSVQQYIKNAYGSQANQYIERLMDDLNGGARVDSSAGIINKGISLFKKASVFASASVVVQQPSAIARALAYINPKHFATSAGSALNLKKHKEVWAEIKKYAPVAIIKEMGYFDTGMGKSTVEWIKGNRTIKDKMDDILSKAPAKADELSWSYIWLAVKNEIQATTNLAPGSEEFLKKVGERFTEVITNTQVYDSVLSRSGMMRSKDTGMKMATAFMAEPTTALNMMVDGIMQGKRGNKKFLASTVGAVSASVILNSILVALVYAARDDDEDETYAEKYVGSLTTELLDGFNPLTYIPFVKDAWSIAQGYDVERSDMSVVSNLWESIEGLFNDSKSGWEKVSDATGAVSSLFGIPLKNLIRDAKGMYNLTKTLTSGTPTTGAGITESVEDAFTSSIPLWDRLHDSDSNADRLYKAIMSGDRTQINRIKGRYDNEQDFESAMRQGLRDNDSRIHEAAQARYDGDIAEYTRIAKEIIREGNFSQDIIVGAINAEMNAIKRDETVEEAPTEDKDEVTSIYGGSDINSAFENGDYALAQEIISELIETKVANGMEEKNAKSSLRSSMTSYWKPLYKQAYQSGDYSEMERIRRILHSSGLYGSANEVVNTVKNWLKS